MSWILVINSCASETGITSPSESCREAIISTSAVYFYTRRKLPFQIIRKSTDCRNPEETKETIAWALPKDTSNSSILMESVKMESRQCWKSASAQSKKNTTYLMLTLCHEARVNVWLSNKMLCQSGVCVTEQQNALPIRYRKFINLIPNHNTGISQFNAHHRFRVDHIIGWNQTWRRRPLPPCKEDRGIGWLTADPPKLYTPVKVVEEATTWCTPGMYQEPAHQGTYAYHRYTPKGMVVQTPLVESPFVKMEATSVKAESKQCNKHQHKEIGGRLNSEKENSPQEEDPWQNWHKPEKAFGIEIVAVA